MPNCTFYAYPTPRNFNTRNLIAGYHPCSSQQSHSYLFELQFSQPPLKLPVMKAKKKCSFLSNTSIYLIYPSIQSVKQVSIAFKKRIGSRFRHPRKVNDLTLCRPSFPAQRTARRPTLKPVPFGFNTVYRGGI